MKRNLILALFLLTSCRVFAQSIPYTPYIIQSNDNVSTVLSEHAFNPLFGKDQWVEKVLKRNRLTYETARELEPGDVIVLPIESKLFTEKTFQDEVKLLESSWEKTQLNQYLAPRKHNFSVSSNIFNRLYKLSDETVAIKGLSLSAEYKKREIFTDNDFSLNPIVAVGTYTQGNASFSSDSDKVAEFTPSLSFVGKLELENRRQFYSFTGVVEVENFSTVVDGQDDYEVLKKSITWSGIEISKSIDIGNHTYSVSGNFLKGVNSENDSAKKHISLKSLIQQHYIADLYINQYSYNFGTETKVEDIGFTLGYRF